MEVEGGFSGAVSSARYHPRRPVVVIAVAVVLYLFVYFLFYLWCPRMLFRCILTLVKGAIVRREKPANVSCFLSHRWVCNEGSTSRLSGSADEVLCTVCV